MLFVQPSNLKDVGDAIRNTQAAAAGGVGYDTLAYRAPGAPVIPAFTRRREVWIGRVAMAGFLATCILEVSESVEVSC